mmetsp:Transcript_23800/g.36198  ORF Transcript_23800/g.36198 Transcript_23800/m.36198 type:complete len:340 (-) Transcript_23800:283-1302(-)
MVRTYTPQERDARRRQSVAMRNVQPSRQSVGGGDDDEESWIADLRAQGVDVSDFLKVTLPPETIDIPDDQSDETNNGRNSLGSNRRMSRLSILSLNSDRADVSVNGRNKRFTQFLDKAYVFDETVGDMVITSFEESSKKRWQREVQEDSKSFDPNSTTEEKIQQNREWALKMARRRAGRNDPPPKPAEDNSSNQNIYPKVQPPPTIPLPKIDEKDFELSEPPLNRGELGITPPPLPHQLADLIPKATRSKMEGIVDGLVFEGTYEEVLESCDPETMVVTCVNLDCASYLQCSRESSLVRCGRCKAVSPAGPFLRGEGRRDDSISAMTGRPSYRKSQSVI